MLQVCVQSKISQSMLIVVLHASFPCRGPFLQRKAGHSDKADLMQLLCQVSFKMSVLNVKRLFLITKLCTQQPSMTLTLFLNLSLWEQTSFSLNIFQFQRLWSVSRWDLGYFSSTLYSVSFSAETLTWYFPHHSHLDETTGISPASDIHSLRGYTFLFFLTLYYYLNFIFYSYFLRFYLMSFLCSNILPQIPYCF